LLSARQYHYKKVSTPVFELFSASAIDSWVSYLTYSPYITIFLLLIAGIWFIPLAEEIALVAAGYLYYSDQVQLTTMLMLLGLGVFCGDFVGFWVGRHWRGRSSRSVFPFLHRSKWVERFKTWLDQHRNRALFLTRFLPGLRLPAHIIVGAHGMPTPIYVRICLIAIAVYVPFIFTLAYSFGAEIDAALASVQRLGHVAWGVLLVAVVVWSLFRFWITRQSLFDQPQ